MPPKTKVDVAEFEMVHARWRTRGITQAQAAKLLGMSERTFRRWSARYRNNGLTELRRPQARTLHGASTEEVASLEALYRENYLGWNVRHFYRHYREEHSGTRSYNWVRERLQAAGLVDRRARRAERRTGVRLRPRPRQSRCGALVHEVGQRAEWAARQRWDLILMYDDATKTVCGGLFVPAPDFWARVRVPA